MTIVQIGPYPIDPSLIKGGVEASVYGLSKEQSKHHRVFVIDIPRGDKQDKIENDSGLAVYRFHNPGTHNKDSVKRVKDIMKVILDLNPTICHIHSTGIFSLALISALKEHSIPVLLTVHGLARIEKMNTLRKHFSLKALYQLIYQGQCERKVLSNQKVIIVDTEYVAKAIAGFNYRRTPEMIVIPQGIDERFFGLNSSSASRTILSVGSISRRKGHLQLIRAFAIAAKNIQDIRLVICGVLADKEYIGEMEKCIDSLQCRDRISLNPDIPREDLLRYYSDSHIFALHSQEESQGIVFAEAMAAGLPVVATRVGGVPYVITDGETGYLSEYDDIESFSSSLIKVMEDDSTWNTLSANCRKAASAYSWAKIAESIEMVYRTIVKQ